MEDTIDPNTCDHSDIDKGKRICWLCGKDMTEELYAHLFERVKDHDKYGE
jgi:hypothetical protein